MAEIRKHVQAPPEAVFEVLRDPASYLLWVVGSKHIRGVDPGLAPAGFQAAPHGRVGSVPGP